MAVYLLHSTVPLTRANGSEVRHYLGYCDDGTFPHRLWEHHNNRHSARIVQAFLAAGGVLWLGNYWNGLTRDDERTMKRNGHLEDKCLRCRLTTLQREIAGLDGTVQGSPHTRTVRSLKPNGSSLRLVSGEPQKETDGTSPRTPQT